MADKDIISTEEKIKIAARKVFMQKGMSGARTKDIAAEAGINLALLNYYFRSKEKLFDLILKESVLTFMGGLQGIINNQETSLEDKIQQIVEVYSDMMIKIPDLPLFILNEIQSDPSKTLDLIGFEKEILLTSFLIQQIRDRRHLLGKEHGSEYQIFINIIALTVFPMLAKPLINIVFGINNEMHQQMMRQRRELIPIWMNAILNS